MRRIHWLIGMLIGCGDGDRHRSTGPDPGDGPEVSYAEEYVPLGAGTMEKLTELREDGTLVFAEETAELRELAPGKVIAHGPTAVAPDGFLRRVREVHLDGRNVVVATEEATLEEVYEEAVIEIEGELSFDDLEGAPRRKPGGRLKRPAASEGIVLEIDEAILYDGDGDQETTADQLRVNGRITLQPAYTFSLEIQSAMLRKLRFVATAAQTVQLTIGSDTGLSGKGVYRLAHGDGGGSSGGASGETIRVELPGGASMEFMWIEPGSFVMGTTEEQEQLLRGMRPGSSFFGLIDKAEYRLSLGSATLSPRWKSEFRRQTPLLASESRRLELTELFMLIFRFPIMRRSFVEAGMEYEWFEQLRDPVPPGAEPSSTGLTSMVQLSNLSEYQGYRLTTMVGFELARLDFKYEPVQTRTRGFITIYAGVQD